jgi:hypothetical protein
LKEQAKLVGKFRKALKDATIKALDDVAQSRDEVSRALKIIFENAISHTPSQLSSAKERLLLGNPPGKSANTLGDQLNWEQLLAHLKEHRKTKLWLITNDHDYFLRYEKRLFLNPALRRELGDIDVFIHNNITDGIAAFAKATGEGQKELPSEERQAEIKVKLEFLEKERDAIVSVFKATFEKIRFNQDIMLEKFSDEDRQKMAQYIKEYWNATHPHDRPSSSDSESDESSK